MASSEIDISNLALGRLGQTRIFSFEENSPESRYCHLFYAQVRDAVLSKHAWNFAVKRASLQLLSTPPDFGYTNSFQLPTGCLRVLSLNNCIQLAGVFEREGDQLLTNQEEAKIRYIFRETDCGKFSPLFVEALAVKLAATICTPLTGSRDQSQALIEEYEKLTEPAAMMADSVEGEPQVIPPYAGSSLVNSRWRGFPGNIG